MVVDKDGFDPTTHEIEAQKRELNRSGNQRRIDWRAVDVEMPTTASIQKFIDQMVHT